MKRLAFSLFAVAAVAAGCSSSKKPDTTASTIEPAPIAPQPVTVTPVTNSDTPAPPNRNIAMQNQGAPGGKHAYTVKKGDTLWSIATKNYGDGKQYTRIVSANPGLTPAGLKIGQTLTIP